MKEAPARLLYESAYRGNIIPVTSVCNVSCVFCSHRQNPHGIQIFRIKPLNPGQVEDLLQFISPEQKIVIGESVTRIIEGEPLTNPHIVQILTLVRQHFPRTTIQITSNGALIDKEMAHKFLELGHIEINLSLNSSSPKFRRMLMNDQNPGKAAEAAKVMADAGITYHGSIVAMPHLTGWDDLGQTLDYLAGAGAATIRVFLPGFTRMAPEVMRFPRRLWQELHEYVEAAAAGLPVPVTVEPGLIKDLKARVKGIIKGSPAEAAGLGKKDVIFQVNGERCLSRVDAFQKVKSGGRVVLGVMREGRHLTLIMEKEPGMSSGLVMEYDIDPDHLKAVVRRGRKYQKVWLLASVLGAPILKAGLQELDKLPGADFDYEVITVPNNFFGGSVMSAGLLVVSDFVQAFRKHTGENRGGAQERGTRTGDRAEAIFVPAAAFDREGRDLTGASFMDLEQATGYKVEIV